jgi:hypothetical protein
LPNGNVVVDEEKQIGWSINWDALSDSLRYIDAG